MHLNAIFTDHETPPTVQLLAPEPLTPNIEMFDFVTAQTVYVTSITGGAPQPSRHRRLASELRRLTWAIPGQEHILGPLRAASNTRRGRHPPAPDRGGGAGLSRPLHSWADGTLIEVDNRSVNLQRQNLNDLKRGFNAWFPFGNSVKGSTPNRFEFSVFDTWYLKDDILVRDGIPELNLLNGAPSSLAGGQSRHQVDWNALVYKDGLGAGFNNAWKSATSVGTGDALSSDTLRFSALGTVNLRFSADLVRLPATHDQPWARGMRVAFQVLNLFDRRQSVQDSAGTTPLAFAPGYLDPVGRTVWLTLRKAFQ